MSWFYDHKGEGNPNVKLSERQVEAIRAKAARPRNRYGWMSALARKYGVSPATIGDIVHGRRW